MEMGYCFKNDCNKKYASDALKADQEPLKIENE
jgi:hypothetical protein